MLLQKERRPKQQIMLFSHGNYNTVRRFLQLFLQSLPRLLYFARRKPFTRFTKPPLKNRFCL